MNCSTSLSVAFLCRPLPNQYETTGRHSGSCVAVCSRNNLGKPATVFSFSICKSESCVHHASQSAATCAPVLAPPHCSVEFIMSNREGGALIVSLWNYMPDTYARYSASRLLVYCALNESFGKVTSRILCVTGSFDLAPAFIEFALSVAEYTSTAVVACPTTLRQVLVPMCYALVCYWHLRGGVRL